MTLEIAWFEPFGIAKSVAAPRVAKRGLNFGSTVVSIRRDASGDCQIRRTAAADLSRPGRPRGMVDAQSQKQLPSRDDRR